MLEDSKLKEEIISSERLYTGSILSLDLAQAGFATLQAGHDSTEKLAVGALAEKLKTAFSNVPVTESKVDLFTIHNV